MTKTVTITCATCSGEWNIETPLCFVPRTDIECTLCALNTFFNRAV